MAGHRDFKNALYAQFARIGHALASPKRIELLDLLGQGEKTVETLARQTDMLADEKKGAGISPRPFVSGPGC